MDERIKLAVEKKICDILEEHTKCANHSDCTITDCKKELEEAKEIIENFEKTSHIDKRRKFFNKISNHLSKHGWFYAEIVSLLGQTAIKLLG